MKKVQKRMKAQPGGVIRFTTCGERRKYKPAAAVHKPKSLAPILPEPRRPAASYGDFLNFLYFK